MCFFRLIFYARKLAPLIPAIIKLIKILDEADLVDDSTAKVIVQSLEVLEKIFPGPITLADLPQPTNTSDSDLPATPGGA